MKHCGVETHGSRKWDPPPHKGEYFIPERGDSIFINPSLKDRTIALYHGYFRIYQEKEIWDTEFFQIIVPQNQGNKLDPHETKVVFLGTMV